MLFDLEDYVVSGCMDPNATNYNVNATVSCDGCCKYPSNTDAENQPPKEDMFQEATLNGVDPITETCCLGLNKHLSELELKNYTEWGVVTDKTGIRRCVRRNKWDYFYRRK